MFVINRQWTKNMHQYTDACVYTRTHIYKTHTHLPVQIYPPAVRFSSPLWSLFMSPCVPPSKLLFLLRSPSVAFHAFLPPACVSIPLLFPHLSSESVIIYFITSLWTKWNVALPSSATFFSSSPVASGVFLPARNLTVTPTTGFFVTFPSKLNIYVVSWVKISCRSFEVFRVCGPRCFWLRRLKIVAWMDYNRMSSEKSVMHSGYF